MKNYLIFGTVIIVLFSGFIFNIEGAEAKFVDQETVSKDKTFKKNRGQVFILHSPADSVKNEELTLLPSR